MTKGEIAKNLFMSGHACSQSVLVAFCDDIGLDRDLALQISSGFGGGIGRLREVCGAFSGAVMVLSMIYGYQNPDSKDKKKELYAHVQELARRFKADNGSIICRDLLGLDNHVSKPTPDTRTSQYYKTRPCPQLVEYTADLLNDYLLEIKNR